MQAEERGRGVQGGEWQGLAAAAPGGGGEEEEGGVVLLRRVGRAGVGVAVEVEDLCVGGLFKEGVAVSYGYIDDAHALSTYAHTYEHKHALTQLRRQKRLCLASTPSSASVSRCMSASRRQGPSGTTKSGRRAITCMVVLILQLSS